MGQIYKKADNVWAWLGEQDDFSDLAFETLDIFFWATKILIFQYCSEALGIPSQDVDVSLAMKFF
jgi:hypothetical protein